MKNKYQDLLALSKDERESTLKTDHGRAVAVKTETAEIQKHVAKTLVAMTKSNEIGSGDLNKEAKRILGEDIRKTFQNVYPLVNVFTAIVDCAILMSEDEYDKADSSKLAYLSPLLAEDATDEMKAKLPEIVDMIKAGKSARDIKDAIGGEKKEPKAVKELRERAEKAEAESGETKKMLQSMFENGTIVPVGFLATDISKTDPLVNSAQFKARVKSDMQRALDDKDDEAMENMQDYFGKAFVIACKCLGVDPLDFLADLAADEAKPAAGQVIETPALVAA